MTSYSTKFNLLPARSVKKKKNIALVYFRFSFQYKRNRSYIVQTTCYEVNNNFKNV